MKLSVVIPVYRVEATLDRCVESVLAQQCDGMEVILVDDGSPDSCPLMCDEWAKRDSRVRVIHQANGGLSDARNSGLAMAQGDYVTFVDSDDFLAPDTYAPVLQLLDDAPETDIAEFPVYWHYGAREQAIMDYGSHVYGLAWDYWLKSEAYRHSFAWNKIYRRRLFRSVRFPKGRVFEDMATLPQLLSEARQVATVGRGLYYYCYNGGGITATASGHELQQLLEHHIKAMALACDTCYYMHVVNIQLDVCRLLNVPPTIPPYPIHVGERRLGGRLRLKAIALKILGINHLSKLYRLKK